ncbi:hypothetical protein AB1N83_009577 [Pleurotus pulmonarius]
MLDGSREYGVQVSAGRRMATVIRKPKTVVQRRTYMVAYISDCLYLARLCIHPPPSNTLEAHICTLIDIEFGANQATHLVVNSTVSRLSCQGP